ncbi:MAG: hypothetical protein IPH88_04350 [Bacteroidales bacterium]|nr:hypothetical protein [Bacteroidales bacterium]
MSVEAVMMKSFPSKSTLASSRIPAACPEGDGSNRKEGWHDPVSERHGYD